MSVNLSPIGGAAAQFFDNNGNPLAGGKLYTYAAGTTTPRAAYTTSAGNVPHTNPIILDSAGRVPGGQIWLTDENVDYKFLLETSTSVLVGTFDNIPSVISGSAADIVYLPAGTGAVATTVQAKLRETVSVKDFGAVGDGLSDDTDAINSALGTDQTIYFPDGIYLFMGNIDALMARDLLGSGKVRYDGFDYPVERKAALNALWAGEFRCWQMAHALASGSTQRVQCPAGVTNARSGFAVGTTMLHVQGTHRQDALRIQRNATTGSTAFHTVVMNLTREETKTLAGGSCILQFHAIKSDGHTGTMPVCRVQYSLEPEQPILEAAGTYTNGNVNVVSESVALSTAGRPKQAPYFYGFDLPADAVQVAVVFEVNFSGIAGAADYIELDGVSVHPGAAPANILQESFSALMLKGKSRYQASYPYAAPRGASTQQGSVSAVASNTQINFAFAINARFETPMATVPQFLFQSPISGTESRLMNVDTGAFINGLGFALSDSGAVITNNGAATAGNRYLCHWTAQVIF